MTAKPTLGQRSAAWRKRKGFSTDPAWVMAKATEELGEVARAMIGGFEGRPGRGDVVQEAAQTIIVLASLIEILRPGTDLFAAVEREMESEGA